MCNKCNGTGVISETICGLCEDNLPHSSCDDTWTNTKECDCRPLKKFNYDASLATKYIVDIPKDYHLGKDKLLALLMRELK